jgi:hypothetical protein
MERPPPCCYNASSGKNDAMTGSSIRTERLILRPWRDEDIVPFTDMVLAPQWLLAGNRTRGSQVVQQHRQVLLSEAPHLRIRPAIGFGLEGLD